MIESANVILIVLLGVVIVAGFIVLLKRHDLGGGAAGSRGARIRIAVPPPKASSRQLASSCTPSVRAAIRHGPSAAI